MQNYFYKAENNDGKRIRETATAKSAIDLAEKLNNMGYRIKYIEKVDNSYSKNNKIKTIFSSNSVNKTELITFSKQFAVMIKSGISILEALDIIVEQQEEGPFNKVLLDVSKELQQGGSLFEVMSDYPHVFPSLYRKMIKAGEEAGLLERVLKNMADYYSWQENIEKDIKGALYYPIIVLGIAVVAVIFMLFFVVPSFQEIFASQGASLPLVTRLIIGSSNFMRKNVMSLLLFFAGLASGLTIFFKCQSGQKYWDIIKLQFPVTGEVYKKIVTVRLCSTLSLLLENGLTLSEGIKLIEGIISNRLVNQELSNCLLGVREGKSLSQLLVNSCFFPSLVLKLIKAGEETGSLPEMLHYAAEYFEGEVKREIEKGITLLEPIMLILLALVVGFIALGVILPMFNMYSIL